MSGCAVCVHGLYEELLAAYNTEVEALRKALTVMKIPDSEWSAHIQRSHTPTMGRSRLIRSLSSEVSGPNLNGEPS